MNRFLKENFFKIMIGLSALIGSIAILIYIVSITKSPSSLNERVTGDPIRIGRLEVAQYDLPKYMKWGDAIESCKALGSGWRLPTKNELKFLFKNKDKIGGFAPEGYWSRTVYDDTDAWCIQFDDGENTHHIITTLSCTRAVRTF
jgi:hypothetical protein